MIMLNIAPTGNQAAGSWVSKGLGGSGFGFLLGFLGFLGFRV